MLRLSSESTLSAFSLPRLTALLSSGSKPAPRYKRRKQDITPRLNAVAIFAALEDTAVRYTIRDSSTAANAVLDPLRIRNTNPTSPQLQNNARQRFSTPAAATAESRRSPHSIPSPFGPRLPAKRYPDANGRKVPETTSAKAPMNRKSAELKNVHKMISRSERRRTIATAATQSTAKIVNFSRVKGKSAAQIRLMYAQATKIKTIHPNGPSIRRRRLSR